MGKMIREQFTHSKTDSVVVIGLGRFGSAVAQSLVRLGHDVMGIDSDEARVQAWSEVMTHAVRCDSTKTNVMRQLGVGDFDHAIVGIGSDLAASLMTIVTLMELGIKDIWVKATSVEHGLIAKRIGANHVVYPEAAMGERVAHLITGQMMDFIEFEDGFAIAKIRAPTSMHNRSLAEAGMQQEYGVTVVGVKHANEDFQHATPAVRLLAGDLLIVSGPTGRIEEFAGRPRKG